MHSDLVLLLLPVITAYKSKARKSLDIFYCIMFYKEVLSVFLENYF